MVTKKQTVLLVLGFILYAFCVILLIGGALLPIIALYIQGDPEDDVLKRVYIEGADRKESDKLALCMFENMNDDNTTGEIYNLCKNKINLSNDYMVDELETTYN